MSVLMCSVMVETAPCPAGPGCQNADKLGDVPLLGVGGEQQQQQTVAAAPDALKSQQQAACIVADADASVDVSSVITQYLGPTTHDAAVAAANAKWQEEAATTSTDEEDDTVPQQDLISQQQQQGRSWRHRLRHLLCCVAPPPSQHQQQAAQFGACSAADLQLVNTLYSLPPQPPRVYREPVIGPPAPGDAGKKTLVLDLDETLVHSSFKPIPNPDYIIPVDIDGRLVDVYVLKRPWVDHFLNVVGPRFEVVVFTASLAKYADPLLDLMDPSGLVRWRLFRESCCPYEGNYVKDLTALGRPLASTIIVDNSPHSYVFQPTNAVPISTFIDDMDDQELLEVLPQLLQVEAVEDVRHHLGPNLARSKVLCLR